MSQAVKLDANSCVLHDWCQQMVIVPWRDLHLLQCMPEFAACGGMVYVHSLVPFTSAHLDPINYKGGEVQLLEEKVEHTHACADE
jgi:hypothetical protein